MLKFVVLGVRLRWRLMRNRLRKGGLVLFVLGLVASAGFAVVAFGIFASARVATDVGRRSIAQGVLGAVLLGWVFLPLMSGGADETVDPTRLALLPLTRRQLAGVLIGGAVSGPATIAVFAALWGLIVGYAPGGVGALIVVAVVPCVFLLGLGLARLTATGLARAQRSRGGRDIAVVLTTLLGATVWLGTQAIGPALQKADDRSVNRIVNVLGWLPTGWPGRALVAAHDHHPGTAAIWLAATAALAALALSGWARATMRLATMSERVSGTTRSSAGAPLGSASTPLGAALAREWRYVRRSPGKRGQFIMTSVMGVGFTVIQVIRNTDHSGPRWAFAGLGAMLFGVSPSFNILGFDSPSLWLDDLSGGMTKVRLRARSLGWLPHVLIPGLLGVVTASVLAGRWQATPLAMIAAVGMSLAGLGVGSFASTVTPMPVLDGDNPWAWRNGMSGKGCSQGLWSVLGLAVMAVCAAPIVIPLVVFYDRPWAYAIAVAGIALGAGIFALGTRLGARRIGGRGPELIAELSPRALT